MTSRRAHNSFSKVHSVGSRGFLAVKAEYQDKRLQSIKRESDGFTLCVRCKRYYKDPERQHFADYKNKIRCFNYEDLGY